jgi:predicted thioesterase
MTALQPGLSATMTQMVSDSMLASYVGSGLVDVFATPELALLLEKAAVAALKDHLPPGKTSVGAVLNFQHLAPTPVGMTVTATATLTSIDGRKLTFAISARDEVEPIAKGTHTRFIVDAAKFRQKAEEKKKEGA